jgi:hypothetical protein
MSCQVQAGGTIELYFYGELSLAGRADVQSHLQHCAECRAALEDLSVIRAALAVRPDVATPPGGDWSGFMIRLNTRIAQEANAPSEPAPKVVIMPLRRRLAPSLAAAAVLALVTLSAVLMMKQRSGGEPRPAVRTPASAAAPVVRAVNPVAGTDPALAAVSDQHFERSKLVVLGLATKDARAADWEYERELAGTLLDDTRLYRLAAEERGMQSLAGVMRDLELVLLQASMSQERDAASLEQLQRLIRRRDLITKMEIVHAGGN